MILITRCRCCRCRRCCTGTCFVIIFKQSFFYSTFISLCSYKPIIHQIDTLRSRERARKNPLLRSRERATRSESTFAEVIQVTFPATASRCLRITTRMNDKHTPTSTLDDTDE